MKLYISAAALCTIEKCGRVDLTSVFTEKHLDSDVELATVHSGNSHLGDLANLMKLARQAGLTLRIDGKLGSDYYDSVAGSWPALIRFVTLLAAQPCAVPDVPQPLATSEAQGDGAAPWEGCKHSVCLKNGACWDAGNCLDPVMPATAAHAGASDEADMFWSADDGDQFYHSLDDAIIDAFNNDCGEVGAELEFTCAARLPNVKVRITGVSEDGWAWEEVTAPTPDAAKGEST